MFVFYMKNLKNSIQLGFYCTRHSISIGPKFFAISMHVTFGFASTSSIIFGLELESCHHFVPMLETLKDTTQQQMQ
jgi:hypothetical protein